MYAGFSGKLPGMDGFMDNFINTLLEIEEYRQALSSAKGYTKPVNIVGPSESQKAHICYALCSHSGHRGIFVAYNEMQARKFYEDFTFYLGDEVLFYPTREVMLYDVEAKSNDAVYQRIKTLDRILEGNFSFAVTSIEAISHKLIAPDILKQNTITINYEDRIDLDNFIEKLVMMAYERVETVERRGQFAVRGGIIDIFSIDTESGTRIELFGDEIDSIRRFDVNTQRSTERAESIRILPAREIIYSSGKKSEIIKTVNNDLKQAGKKNQSLSLRIGADIDRLKESWYFPGIDRYIPYIADIPYSLPDYIQDDVLVFMDEPVRQRQRLDNLLLEHEEACKGLLEKAQLLPQSKSMFFDYEGLYSRVDKKKAFYMNTMNVSNPISGSTKVYSIPGRLMGSFQGNVDMLCEGLTGWKKRRK